MYELKNALGSHALNSPLQSDIVNDPFFFPEMLMFSLPNQAT